MKPCGIVLVVVLGAVSSHAQPAGDPGPASPKRLVYSRLMDPREHPDYDRRAVKPPSWDTFGNRTQFVALRGFGVENNRIVGFKEELDRYLNQFRLGNVVWPSYPIVFAENLPELADEIAARGAFLFDIWGFVPGSGPGGYWQQFRVPDGVFDMLESRLGDRWLGMDVGEQDGRYIGGYASQQLPVSDDRFAAYLHFQHHFQYMGEELGNRLSTLVSLNFGHQFLKEGTYTTIGAETGQALPNSQVYYAFIRGAGKQYGVPWFGNASVWNRWGWKSYDSEGTDHGPTKGTSLNLLKRLLYSHILYNCVFVGFESGWIKGDELTPIGRIQQGAVDWTERNGQPGVMHTPVALMLDFHSGWSFPRHLYSSQVYRVWGNIPYGPGDYLADGVLDLLYPGYQDSSYYHDETGFLAPTPYGDSADCLLSDAPLWLLKRYPVLVVAGEVEPSHELAAKLAGYMTSGGCAVVTSGNLARFVGGLAGVEVRERAFNLAAGQEVQIGEETCTEDVAFDLDLLATSRPAKALAECAVGETMRLPAALEIPVGKGRLIALASPFGVASQPVTKTVEGGVDKPLEKPYPMLKHVRAILNRVFSEQVLFKAGEGLSLVTCRKSAGEYTLGVSNNSLTPRAFKIESLCGPIESIEELPLDQSEKGATGYLPEGSESAAIGLSDDATIAGGDVRVFRVRVTEQGVEELPHEAPAPRPRGRILPLRGHAPIKEEILARPTFFERFDGVMVDWRYLHERDRAALSAEAGWIARQGLRVWVDLASGINLYPDIRLVNNDEPEYARSMAIIEDVLTKMPALGARDLIVCLHRVPENNFTYEQTWQSFSETLRLLCAKALAGEITIYLRDSMKTGNPLDKLIALVREVGAPNLRLAPSLALLIDRRAPVGEVENLLGGVPGLWIAAAPQYDVRGDLWSINGPLAAAPDPSPLLKQLDITSEVPILLDGVYATADDEYADIGLLTIYR